MKYLVYAIQRAATAKTSSLPVGVDGLPAEYVDDGQLAAIYSLVDFPVAVGIPHLIAYAQVIEALARNGDVLPLRHGCLMNGDAELRMLLRQRSDIFLNSLDEVSGCVEMGLRALLPDADMPRYSFAPSPTPSPQGGDRSAAIETPASHAASASDTAGTHYLFRRKAYFDEKDSRRIEAGTIGAYLRSMFEPACVKCLEETPAETKPPLLSMRFLLRREKIDSFRQVFLQIQKTSLFKILLTGPWPPYSFVAPTQRPSESRALKT